MIFGVYFAFLSIALSLNVTERNPNKAMYAKLAGRLNPRIKLQPRFRRKARDMVIRWAAASPVGLSPRTRY